MVEFAPLEAVWSDAAHFAAAAVATPLSPVPAGGGPCLPPSMRPAASGGGSKARRDQRSLQQQPPLCDLYQQGYSGPLDDIMDAYTPGDAYATLVDASSAMAPAAPAARSPHGGGSGAGGVGRVGYSDAADAADDGGYDHDGGDTIAAPHPARDRPQPAAPAPAPAAPAASTASHVVQLALYVVSGILLILLLEQFVQIGSRMQGLGGGGIGGLSAYSPNWA